MSEGYKLWCKDEKSSKCIICKDVTFNEAQMLNFKELPNKTKDNNVMRKMLEVESSSDTSNFKEKKKKIRSIQLRRIH